MHLLKMKLAIRYKVLQGLRDFVQVARKNNTIKVWSKKTNIVTANVKNANTNKEPTQKHELQCAMWDWRRKTEDEKIVRKQLQETVNRPTGIGITFPATWCNTSTQTSRKTYQQSGKSDSTLQ